MSEFTTDTFPNDDDFQPGENLLYSNEQLAPACKLLAYVSNKSEEEIEQFLADFRTESHRGDYTLLEAQRSGGDHRALPSTPQQDLAPFTGIGIERVEEWGALTNIIDWTNRLVQVDHVAGAQNEHIVRSILFDSKSQFFAGREAADVLAEQIPAIREQTAALGGANNVSESMTRLQQELELQINWSYIVQGINMLGGRTFGLVAFTHMRDRYHELAADALQALRLPTLDQRLVKIRAMQQAIAEAFANQPGAATEGTNSFLYESQRVYASEPAYEVESRDTERACAMAQRMVAQEAEQKFAQERADRAASLSQLFLEHTEESTPTLSGKARKREGYENLWHTLIGRNADPTLPSMLDHDANKLLSALHMLRQMTASSFDGVYEAHAWQEEVRVFEQAIIDEYGTLGRQKELPLKESVASRFDWLRNHWDAVAGQVRNIPGFPVERVAAALFPEVAATIQQKEQKAEQRQTTVAQRIGSNALEQLVVQEVDWEILPVERIGERIQQEAQHMTRGKRADAGRNAVQEVRVRDLVELSTLFDNAVVHVSRAKEGITRSKNEPYFVITFSYGGQDFALAENLVLDNATFILPESEFSWKDVFSLPRGAVGEFGARRINHPSVDETGEYEGGPNTHVNAIFAKLDKALAEQQ